MCLLYQTLEVKWKEFLCFASIKGRLMVVKGVGKESKPTSDVDPVPNETQLEQ